jgi:hypothetical protein
VFLLGSAWMVSGALMAFNPPPHDVRRAAALPFIGWITMALGIYIAIKVLYTSDAADAGKAPRHANGKEAGARESLKLLLGMVFLPVCGAFAVWDGAHRGSLSLVGMGTACLALGLLATPFAFQKVRWMLGRGRR